MFIRKLTVVGLILGCALGVLMGGGYFLNASADRFVRIQAERSSLAWATYIGAELKRVEEITNGAPLTAAEQDFLVGVRKFGKIFRFKLFDRNGQVRLVSDDLHTGLANNRTFAEGNKNALMVITTGRPFTIIEDGTQKPDRPNIYAEAYVPVNRNGNLVAIAEVYIDGTGDDAAIRADFAEFGLTIAAIMLLGFCIPGAALTVMLRRLSEQNDAQKRVERQLQDALTDAERANKAKSDFLATMSHELRTPLNAINGFSEMFIGQFFGELGSPKYKEYATDIRSSSAHLLNLVNDILDLSMIEAGELPLHHEQLDIDDLARDCSRFIIKDTGLKRIRYAVDIAPGIPDLIADRRAVKQILINLLSNAAKFTPEGGTISLSARAADGHHVFQVRDSGAGIPEDKLHSLTVPFVRAETDPYMAVEGTGLGLAIVKSLVELHGGHLTIESKVGEGTVIIVSIPSDGSALSPQTATTR